MKLVICGAGQVGRQAAATFATDYDITMIDHDVDRLEAVADSLDVATLLGNCADADVLHEAGAATAGTVVAATRSDEINILTAAIAKRLGAKKSIARVHHASFFEKRRFDYEAKLGIDRLICPEHSTAIAIASNLRNPGALAIESFGRGAIQMQQLPVSTKSVAIGRTLAELDLASGVRVASITRDGEASIPEATTKIRKGDRIVLVGNAPAFQEARRVFHDDDLARRKVIIMGGTSISVWLCRALHDRNFSVRLFEIDPQRAEKLADKLSWVTVVKANPLDRTVSQEEHIGHADAFVALRTGDEDNIIAAVQAKAMGVKQVQAVVDGDTYLDLVYHMGVDRVFNPSLEAVREIQTILDDRPLQRLSTLADGVVDAYRVRTGSSGKVIGTPLKELKLAPNWIVAAIRRGDRAWVPGADDALEPGDTALLIGRHGMEKELKKLLAG